IFLLVLTACGSGTPAASPPTAAPAAAQPTAAPPPTSAPKPTAAPAAAEPTAAPAAAAPTAAAEPTAAPAAEAPTAEATATPGHSTVGTGATKVVWWHITTDERGRTNWQNLANDFVKDHPDVSIEITVIENQAFKQKLATAMQSGSPPDIFQSWGGG